LSHRQYLNDARLVFEGVMLAGPTATVGGRQVLAGTARVRVIRYVKGHGPAVVTVTSGVNQAGNGANSEGIEPEIGQRWMIFTASVHMPYETSICSGSRPLAS
jgi:hypothetical protein